MNKIKTCRNNCIFCFISQLPQGLRSTLYIKDDDYLESYQHGNFITLTNLSKKDIEKIIKFKIGPLHVSLHSLDRVIRNMLFGNTFNITAIDNLLTLDRNGIETNIQIVLCPGINDGKDLDNTIKRLLTDFRNILSIGIVPVGITKFNKMAELAGFDKNASRRLIKYIKNLYGNNKKVFLSDEFYIIAGIDLPDYKSYGKFYQVRNGIGKSADFLKQAGNIFMRQKISLKSFKKRGNILVITSEYGEVILNKLLKFLKNKIKSSEKRYNIKTVKILSVKNNFLGGNVKVTGLLTGEDIIDVLKKENLNKFYKILIPECIFNPDGYTIDNISRNEIKSINPNIEIIKENGLTFTREILYNS